jgi:redox-sensitive bicupin YhaK (pirin superfamily)
MRGFQLWINLPAKEKMKPAGYRDLQANEIPTADLPHGGLVKVVAGTAKVDGVSITGPIGGISTQPLFIDVRLPEGGLFTQALPEKHAAFVYPYEGSVSIEGKALAQHQAGVLSEGGQVHVQAGKGGAQFLLLAARPLGEEIVQYGPFVMNSRAEIEQAIQDYQSGNFV